MTKLNIDIFTFCYNELKILPFVAQYWKNLGVRRVVVYDNESTDGSRQFIKDLPFAELRTYKTDNQLDDLKLLELKNTVWKESKDADFVIVCDLDECVWSDKPELAFQSLKQEKIAAVTTCMQNLISVGFPRFDEKKLMHEIVNRFHFDFWTPGDGPGFGPKKKMLIIDPKHVIETNYKVGCYESSPILEEGFTNLTNSDLSRFKFFHFHDVGLARKLKRYAERKARMSKANIDGHLSDFYLDPPSETILDFYDDLEESWMIDVI